MLVFGMKDVSYVVINDNINVRVSWEGNDVKLCIDAPRDVVIERDKVYEKRCLKQGISPNLQFDKLVKGRKRFHTVRPEAGGGSKTV